MNEELTLHFAETVLGRFSFNRRLLAFDSFECHIMDSVKRELSKGKIKNVMIPGGCTKYIDLSSWLILRKRASYNCDAEQITFPILV